MIKPKQKPNSTWLDALKGLAILGGIVWVAGWFIEGVNEAADQRVRDDVASEKAAVVESKPSHGLNINHPRGWRVLVNKIGEQEWVVCFDPRDENGNNFGHARITPGVATTFRGSSTTFQRREPYWIGERPVLVMEADGDVSEWNRQLPKGCE